MEITEEIIKYLDGLVGRVTQESIPTLIKILKESSSQEVKHKVALLLHDSGNQRALVPLIEEIKNPLNHNYRGTLVYACETLDCSDYLELFVDLIINNTNEVAMTSVMVLENMKKRIPTDLVSKQIQKLNNVLEKGLDNNESIEEAIAVLESW